MSNAAAILRNKVTGLRQMWAFDNRLQIILNRMLFSRTSDIYVLGELRVLIDYAGGDASGTRDCLVSPMYRELLVHLHLEAGAIVLDLGANGGGFPLLCHHLGIPIRKLVCVELNPNTYRRLQFNVLENLDCEIHVLNAGIASESHTIDLVLGKGSTGDSLKGSGSLTLPDIKQYRIPLITLEGVFEKYLRGDVVDICKIDIEGAEHDVVALRTQNVLSRCRYLIIEIHDVGATHSQEVTLNTIKDLGFTVLRRSGDYPDVFLLKNTSI